MSNINNEKIYKVLANSTQSFSNMEKATARNNIDALGSNDVGRTAITNNYNDLDNKPDLSSYTTDAVRYVPQTLTLSQQDQARSNIDAAKNAVATQYTNGLMSNTDRTKLDGIAVGAEVNAVNDVRVNGSSVVNNNKIANIAVPVNDVLVNGTSVVDSTGKALINITQPDEIKYFRWDVGGDPSQGTWNDSQWTQFTGGPNTIYMIPNLTDSSNLHVQSNLTANDPEIFKSSDESAWIRLKKGLWFYDINVELECVTAGTTRTILSLWVRVQDYSYNYILARPYYMPTNAIVTTYTKHVSGIVYIPGDPIISQGNQLSYTFRVGIDYDTDSTFRIRQQSLQFVRLFK